jgi:DNA invertase Pin-like site-specific DNA recombinase
MITPQTDSLASGKLRPWHLDRAAIVYIRQSAPQQVLDHQESTARQYALAERAVALGWPRSQVQIIDDDLGKGGRSIEGRPGFQRLLAEVALDRVGLILALEMSRLARSCKDRHHLLELCARFRVLLADADGVYDPTEYADRLVPGLTGMMNEAELHIIKQGMYQGKLNRARRGELVVRAPIGHVKSPTGEVTFDPDEQAQDVIRRIFDEFDRRGAVHGVLRSLIADGIRLPVRPQSGPDRGKLVRRAPCRETVRHVLRHPMYAGAYRSGFRPTGACRQVPGRPRSGRGAGLAPEDCLVFLKDHFPAYITYERFEANRARPAADRSRAESAGAVRDGGGSLAGVVWCGRCGRRMYVRYGRADRRPSYICSTLRSDYGLPLCQSVTAAEVEAWVAEQVLEVLQPAAPEASLAAAAEVEQRRRQVIRHWEQRPERARYEADRAARQYQACEPEDRLVARTLERRWEEAPRAAQGLESEFDRFVRSQPRLLGADERERIRRLAKGVPMLWQAPTTTPADRRQVVRLLVDRVVLTVDPGADRVAVRVERAGGAVRERTIHRPVQGYKDQQSWSVLAARLSELHGHGETPEAIAATLDREGFRPPKRASGFTAGMVRRLLHELGLRPRVSRASSSAAVLSPDERWLHDLAGPWASRRTRCTGGGRRAGFEPARSAAGAGPGRCGRTSPNWTACGR